MTHGGDSGHSSSPDSGCAAVLRQCFSSARPVIGGIAIAAVTVAIGRGSNNDVALICVTNGVRRDGSIIVTASANTGVVASKCKPA